ncbi:MAG: formylglycine-generating enzyme family protein [Spirochaetes bacterium]|nr:formylglycine-generating enzyme family protein [Spirochaetota bacterium]MBN2772302.1 formylglycine-generating enzyme family protein [Spirochaetota bacterium]
MQKVINKSGILCFVLLCGLILSCGGGGGGSDKEDPETTTPETVTISRITGVTAPKYGQTPVAVIDETEEFTGTVSWSPAHSTFAATTVYTATVTLEAKTGFTFDGLSSGFFELSEAGSVSNGANSGVVTAVFPATTSASETGFDEAVNIKDQFKLAVGSETVYMIYANDLPSATFPIGETDVDTATINKKFFMSETTVTNAVFKEVLQWAYDNGKFSTTSGAHNELTAANVKYGGQILIDLAGSYEEPTGVFHNCNIAFEESTGTFSVVSGFEDHPVVYVSWYGSVMFCNWLTEMRDGNTGNVVYTGIDTTWTHDETVEEAGRNGYRLPSSNEFEYAARYRGAETVNTVSGTIEGTDFSAMTIKWTKGDSASGAIANYNDESANRAVAWYWQDPEMGANSRLMVVKGKLPNTLGLYDMSGNVLEWCFDQISVSSRIVRGGGWDYSAQDMQVGLWYGDHSDVHDSFIGFRFARTR